MPLSDTFVRKAKHTGRPAGDKHADGGGLYLYVTAAGRYWRLRYRFAGREKLLSLGIYPSISLAQARQRRDEAKKQLADGIDPSIAKRAARAGMQAAAAGTVEAIGRRWLELKKDGWSDTHHVRERRNLEKDLFPFIGKWTIADVEPPDLLAVLRKVEARGALETAHRVLLTARGLWQYAIAEGLAQRDITQDIAKALKPRLKRNYPAIIEPGELAALLRACDAYKGGPVVRTALFIAPILFQRPGNLTAMRWADVDLDQARWSIPSQHMKRTKMQKVNGQPHNVPLPRQVVEALRELHPLTCGREHVFPGLRDPKKPMSEAALNVALASMGYKDRHSAHGYRATGRTILRQVLKYPADVIEAQLAHKGQITHAGAYDRATFFDERGDMLQAWADYLDKLRAGAEVIRLRA